MKSSGAKQIVIRPSIRTLLQIFIPLVINLLQFIEFNSRFFISLAAYLATVSGYSVKH